MKGMTAGPPFPLETLSSRERYLHDRDRATSRLSYFEEKRPDPNLLIYQLTRAVKPRLGPSHERTKIAHDAMSLFAALGSRDALESMADRLLIGLQATAMSSIERAAETDNPQARNINIRAATTSTKTFLEVAKFREQRRALAKQQANGSANGRSDHHSDRLNGYFKKNGGHDG